MYCGGGDLCDGFYQFKCEQLGEDFGFNFPAEASEYRCGHVYEDRTWNAVGGHEVVYPCFVGLPMGWSFALWAMHTTVSSIVAASSEAKPDPSCSRRQRLPGQFLSGRGYLLRCSSQILEDPCLL